MNNLQAAKKALKQVLDPFEALTSQAKPFIDEGREQITPIFGNNLFSNRPREIAREELSRAREAEKIEEMQKEEKEKNQTTLSMLKEEYRAFENKTNSQDQQMVRQAEELQQEVAALAKTAGVETSVHLETVSGKVGVLDIKRLKNIISNLKAKADESKSASDLVTSRTAKRTTGMMAWVSGKQGKIYEQNTMALQG